MTKNSKGTPITYRHIGFFILFLAVVVPWIYGVLKAVQEANPPADQITCESGWEKLSMSGSSTPEVRCGGYFYLKDQYLKDQPE